MTTILSKTKQFLVLLKKSLSWWQAKMFLKSRFYLETFFLLVSCTLVICLLRACDTVILGFHDLHARLFCVSTVWIPNIWEKFKGLFNFMLYLSCKYHIQLTGYQSFGLQRIRKTIMYYKRPFLKRRSSYVMALVHKWKNKHNFIS